jgi:serine/threonine protein kinase
VKDFELPGKKGKFNLLAQEYAQHGNLLDFIKQRKPNLPNRRFLMREIASAVEHLHCNSIVHRDIKLDNILIM